MRGAGITDEAFQPTDWRTDLEALSVTSARVPGARGVGGGVATSLPLRLGYMQLMRRLHFLVSAMPWASAKSLAGRMPVLRRKVTLEGISRVLLQTPGLRALDVSHTAVDADALLALAPAWAHLEVSGPGSVD